MKTFKIMKAIFRELFVTLFWGIFGFLSFVLGNHLGNVPYSFRKLIYNKIDTIFALKFFHIFLEIHLYKFLILFISSIMLLIITRFYVHRIILFVAFFNYSSVPTIYNFYFTNKWDTLQPGSIKYYLVATASIFSFISLLIALIGCYCGHKIRKRMVRRIREGSHRK